MPTGDKGLISKISKEFLQNNKKNTGISMKKWAKDSNGQFIDVEAKSG